MEKEESTIQLIDNYQQWINKNNHKQIRGIISVCDNGYIYDIDLSETSLAEILRMLEPAIYKKQFYDYINELGIDKMASLKTCSLYVAYS